MLSEELERPCTPRKRLIQAQQEDRDVGLRIALSFPSTTTADKSSNQPSARNKEGELRDFCAEYVHKVLQTAVATPRR